MLAEKRSVLRRTEGAPAGSALAVGLSEAHVLCVDVITLRQSHENLKKVLVVEDIDTSRRAPTEVWHVEAHVAAILSHCEHLGLDGVTDTPVVDED